MAQRTIPRVCVVGAGVSGVVAAAHLKVAGVEVTVFERASAAGGVWLYDERSPLEPAYPSIKPSEGDVSYYPSEAIENWDDCPLPGCGVSPLEKLKLLHAPPGPAYIGLKNNVSTRLMRVKLNAWKPGTEDHVDHSVLREYIQDTSQTSGVDSSTVYNTRVDNVLKEGIIWHVHTSTLSRHERFDSKRRRLERRQWEFDAVVVASGHYHAPLIPDIPGLREWKERWPDRVKHSKGYRKPDEYRGQNVLFIGAGVSSTDIARELGPSANHIYQTSRGGKYDLPAHLLPENATRIGEVASFDIPEGKLNSPLANSEPIPGVITLRSGHKLCNIHAIIICTGYQFSLPFLRSHHNDAVPAPLADERVLITDGTQMHNLHRDIFYIPDPTLAFVGVPFYTATFTLFEFQALAVAAVFGGRAALPGKDEMRAEYEARVQRKGFGRAFHDLRGEEEAYVAELVGWINRKENGVAEVEGHTAEWHAAKKEQVERMKKMLEVKESQASTLVNGTEALWACR